METWREIQSHEHRFLPLVSSHLGGGRMRKNLFNVQTKHTNWHWTLTLEITTGELSKEEEEEISSEIGRKGDLALELEHRRWPLRTSNCISCPIRQRRVRPSSTVLRKTKAVKRFEQIRKQMFVTFREFDSSMLHDVCCLVRVLLEKKRRTNVCLCVSVCEEGEKKNEWMQCVCGRAHTLSFSLSLLPFLLLLLLLLSFSWRRRGEGEKEKD